MKSLTSHAEYLSAIEDIHTLKLNLFTLASTKGNLDPEVIELSQYIDEYIVMVQRYWKSHRDAV